MCMKFHDRFLTGSRFSDWWRRKIKFITLAPICTYLPTLTVRLERYRWMCEADRRGESLLERCGTRWRANSSPVSGRDEPQQRHFERQLCRLHGPQCTALGCWQWVYGDRWTAARPRQLRVHRGVATARHQHGCNENRQGHANVIHSL